jgi:hypothetical protein
VSLNVLENIFLAFLFFLRTLGFKNLNRPKRLFGETQYVPIWQCQNNLLAHNFSKELLALWTAKKADFLSL